jgi:KDO2-lipid IV(A) lauroyltransferase
VILGHYGNWEWLPCIGLDKDIEFLSIYKPLRNKVFDKMFKELRSKTSTKLIAKNDTLRTLVKYRRDNIFNVSGFIGDQTPNKKNIHYWTKFLNQDTPILQGAERIAKKLDSAVVFLKMTKKKRGHYQVDLIPISNNPKETADFEITEKHSRELEKLINESPAYWLWSHKRWKHKKND